MIKIIQQPPQFAPSRNQIIYEFTTDNSGTLYFNIIVRNAKNDDIIAKNKIYIAPDSSSSSIDLSHYLSAYASTPILKNDVEINSYDTTIRYNIEVRGIRSNGTETGEIININNKYAYNAKLDSYKLFDFLNNSIVNGSQAEFLTSFPINQKIHNSTDFRLYFISNNSPLRYFKISIETIDNIKIDKQINFVNNDKVLHSILISPFALANEFDLYLNFIKNIKVTGYDAGNNELTETRTFYPTHFKCGIDVVNIHWENKEGGFDSFAFTHPKKQLNTTKETITTNQLVTRNSGVYSTDKKIIKVDNSVTYTVTSPALSDWGYDKMSEIIQSRNVYVENEIGELVPIFLNENSINILQKKYTKKYNYLTLSFTVDDNLKLNTYTNQNFGDAGFEYTLDIML